MGLKKISFIHIGDIHYPELSNSGPLGDLKGNLPSPHLVEKLAPRRIAAISSKIAEIIEKDPSLIGAIQTGDITTRGNLDLYKQGIGFLTRMLQMSSACWENKFLVCVPGNHDIDRSSIKQNGNADEKFKPLTAAWEEHTNFPKSFYCGVPSCVDNLVSLPGDLESTVRIIPVNTCLLCGEYFSLPTQFKGELQSILEKLKGEIPHAEFADLLIEQVDCPAMSRLDVEKIAELIKSSAHGSVAIIAGHHPLLPQPTPRISGYVELINAGFIRESILETERSAIYLHGHIHQDPLYVISNHSIGTNRLIHVSAPALEDGFNQISIYFSEITGEPIGLRIVPFRFGDQMALNNRSATTLRLIDNEALWNEVNDEWMSYILSQLPSPASILRYLDIHNNLPPNLKKRRSTTKTNESLQQALETLELLEVITITNRSKAPQQWQLRRRSI